MLHNISIYYITYNVCFRLLPVFMDKCVLWSSSERELKSWFICDACKYNDVRGALWACGQSCINHCKHYIGTVPRAYEKNMVYKKKAKIKFTQLIRKLFLNTK